MNFDTIEARLTEFCNNDKTLPIRISVLSYDNSDDHQLYGKTITSVREIGMGRTKLEITNKRGRAMGHISVDNFVVDMKPSLKSYMQGGWKLNCTIAIDFTLSNLPIKNYRSKHR